MKMNPEIKQRWVDALQSGQYKKEKGGLGLTNGEGFCCLGVLCNIHALETGNKWKNPKSPYYLHELASSFMPPQVKEWAGFPPNSHNIELKLAKMNDDENKSFKKIADWIEKNL